jgi:hypothetical protein
MLNEPRDRIFTQYISDNSGIGTFSIAQSYNHPSSGKILQRKGEDVNGMYRLAHPQLLSTMGEVSNGAHKAKGAESSKP